MVDKGEGSHPVYVGDNRSSKRCALDYGDNYEYFEMIPDELVILIFTKLLISSSDKTVDTVDDIKLLAQCSILSKRFHVLVWQLPTLSIYCPSITKLYDLCPKFLKKFKHITSLQINHETSEDVKDLPAIIWEATYRPHSYCLSIISYKSFTFYRDQQIKHSVMIANDADADPAKDSDMFKSVYFHYLNLMHLHHMLVSSIKDLENLQRLVVTELNDRGTFILEADVLVELRNCSATNLEQVQVRCRHGCHSHFDIIIEDRDDGYVLKNLLFHIIEWCEKTTHDDQIDKNNVFDDGDGGIPRALTFRGYYGEGLKFFLKTLLSKTYDINVFHDRDIHALLLKLKCAGNLL